MKTLLALFALLLSPSLSLAEAVVGQAAPAFQVKDAGGKDQSLQAYAGQWLVLEWYNKDCPYVKKHYGSGNMQSLQKAYTAKGVKWLTVISSAPGKQGYLEPAQALANAQAAGSSATAILIDSSGTMGQAYGAKTTPHMYVIDPKGQLVYAGAIDDNNSADPAVIPASKNYVSAALDAAMAGRPVAVASSQPYGCSVKY
ncbi:MAG TPA: thioredoxin family protein [bacterium]|nr:thioredoxin family protein [bacterium]